MVNFDLRQGLDDPPKGLGQGFLAEKFSGEGVSLKNFFVIDGHGDEADVRNLSENDGIKYDIEEFEVGSQYFPGPGAIALDEEFNGVALSEEQFEIFIENDAVEGGLIIGFFLEEEGAAALDDEGEQVGLEDGLVSDEVGESEVVDEEDVADDEEVEVGPMGGEKHDGRIAVPLYLPDLLEHFHVDGDLLEQALEGLVKGVGHAPHHGDFDLGY